MIGDWDVSMGEGFPITCTECTCKSFEILDVDYLEDGSFVIFIKCSSCNKVRADVFFLEDDTQPHGSPPPNDGEAPQEIVDLRESGGPGEGEDIEEEKARLRALRKSARKGLEGYA